MKIEMTDEGLYLEPQGSADHAWLKHVLGVEMHSEPTSLCGSGNFPRDSISIGKKPPTKDRP